MGRRGGERLAEGSGLQATATLDVSPLVCAGREGGSLKSSRVAARQPGGGSGGVSGAGGSAGPSNEDIGVSFPQVLGKLAGPWEKILGGRQNAGEPWTEAGATADEPRGEWRSGKGPRAGVRPRLPQPEHAARTVGTDGPPRAPACGPASPPRPGTGTLTLRPVLTLT